MSTWKRCSAAAWFALGVMMIYPTGVRADDTKVDPNALRILKQMTDHLDGAQRFSVNTQNVLEDLHSSGHRVDLDMTAKVTVSRPNRLRAVRTGEQINQSFFYDGKTLTLYNPTENVYAIQTAPATIEKMLDLARETIGIVLPAADLVYRNAYPLMTQDLTLAAVVGKAIVGGVKCDHLLFSHPGADFQVWVEEGKSPWPRKYVVTETDTPEKLTTTTYLTDWNPAPAVDDSLFHFVPPKGSSETRFIPYGTSSGPGR